MTSAMRIYWLAVLLSVLAACASGPTFDTSGVDRALTPRRVAAQVQDAGGKRVLWGGVILATTNLRERTDIEVLAYPLDADNRPRRDDDPLGRFIIEQAGYLEAREFGPGKLITVSGTLLSPQSSKIGDAEYLYPVVQASQLKLWKERAGTPRLHFGIGIGIHN